MNGLVRLDECGNDPFVKRVVDSGMSYFIYTWFEFQFRRTSEISLISASKRLFDCIDPESSVETISYWRFITDTTLGSRSHIFNSRDFPQIALASQGSSGWQSFYLPQGLPYLPIRIVFDGFLTGNFDKRW